MVRRGSEQIHDSLFSGESFGVMGAAHELKAPTALIRQLALELKDHAAASEQERLLLDQIILTAERSLRLTNNLTKTAALDEALFELEPVNVQQVCEEVAHEMTPLYQLHGRRIDVRSRRRPPLVVANRDLLRRILLGFADNALHYGGERTPVLLEVTQKISEAHVGVRDQGPLVASKRHLTTNSVVTGRPESSGIGLHIAARFAEIMHARIGSMKHHNGMTYYLSLPVSEQLSLL